MFQFWWRLAGGVQSVVLRILCTMLLLHYVDKHDNVAKHDDVAKHDYADRTVLRSSLWNHVWWMEGVM